MPTGETSDGDDAAGVLFDRWQAHHTGAPTPRSTPKHAARRTDVVPTAAAGAAAGGPEVESEPVDLPVATRTAVHGAVAHEAVPEHRSRPAAPPETGASTDVEFPPRTRIRLLVGVLLLVLLGATAFSVYRAFGDPTTLTVGMAGTLGLLTLAVYAVRAGSTPTRLAIRSGQLEILHGSRRELYDLSSGYTPVEIVGTPGHRSWKVLIGRIDREPVVIDASMVDPASFTEAVLRHRPASQP